MHELPLAKEEWSKSEKSFSSDKAVGFGKVKARVAYGGQAGIDEAVETGESCKAVRNGQEFYFERQFEAGTKKSTNKSQKALGTLKLDNEAYKAFAAAIEGISFSIEFTQHEVKQIEDGKLPVAVIEKLRKAGLACNIAMQDADKIIKALSGSSANAKATHANLPKRRKVASFIMAWARYYCCCVLAT